MKSQGHVIAKVSIIGCISERMTSSPKVVMIGARTIEFPPREDALQTHVAAGMFWKPEYGARIMITFDYTKVNAQL